MLYVEDWMMVVVMYLEFIGQFLGFMVLVWFIEYVWKQDNVWIGCCDDIVVDICVNLLVDV